MNRMTALLTLLALPLFTGCPDFEGPIDVLTTGMDGTEVVTWAEAGSDDFQACDNGATNPEAVAACGPHGVGEPGTYTIRVEWMGCNLDKDVTIEKDRDYQANAEVTFDAEELGCEG